MLIKDDPVAKVLDQLMNFDDILACMVSCRNMISVEPSGGTNSFKPEIHQIWDSVKQTMDAQFGVITQFSGFGELTYRVMDYEILMYVLPDTETALVAIIPTLANKGLIEIQLENTRRKIQKIREEEGLI